MSERRKSDEELGAERDADRAVARDLQALHRITDADLPALGDTAHLLRESAPGRAGSLSEEGFWMKSRRVLSARPWVTAAVSVAVVATILGIIPVSYERTTGHDVVLRLADPAPDAAALDRIASEFKNALGASELRVHRSMLSEPGTEIEVFAPSRSRHEVTRTAGAYAAVLGGRGIHAQAEVVPRRERVSSTVYALAMDRAIELRIDRAGKTPAQIEADVRSQLEAAGIQNPEVHVSEAAGQTRIEINSDSDEAGAKRDLKLEVNAGGTDPLNPTIHRFEVERKAGMTDAEVKADVERQMREAGVEGEVTVQNGQIHIEVHKKR
jgi:hypothetical protein